MACIIACVPSLDVAGNRVGGPLGARAASRDVAHAGQSLDPHLSVDAAHEIDLVVERQWVDPQLEEPAVVAGEDGARREDP